MPVWFRALQKKQLFANMSEGRCFEGGCCMGASAEVPLGQEAQRERFLQRRRLYERGRYWSLTSRVRLRRLKRSARHGGRSAAVSVQTTLEGDMARPVRSDGAGGNRHLSQND